jgi:diguanylate cyclase (GGDEF)-like protein
MSFQKLISWLAGNEDLTEINRIYNIACFIAMLFCLMAAVESALASLSILLIANNFFFSIILALAFYLSRFKQKFGASRLISVLVLLFIYTPLLWIYNGGSTSGIPYYILLFSSFLTILIVGKKDDCSNNLTLNGIVLIVFSIIITGLILLEFIHPEIFYQYKNQSVRYADTIISMLFALASNYFILRAFIELYYKQLDKVKEYSEKLEALVVRDSMTNLYNHAFIVNRLSEEIEKAARYQRPLSILMIDIDHFKRVNDTYGHTFGDEVLTQIAQSIQTKCRSVDIVARYGGEEFLVILPETCSTSAAIIANRLRQMIADIPFENGITVTISGGIAQYQTGDTASTMFTRADSLLYEAKNEGRNRISLAQL